MLIKCQECGKDVSDKAFSCPNCGCPIDNNEEVLKSINDISENGYDELQEKNNKTEKKKDSVLSVVAIFLSLFSLTYFIGMIIALIDICINDKTKSHVGSVFAMIISIIYFIATGGQVFEIMIQ